MFGDELSDGVTSLPPQLLQNWESAGLSLPQFGQIIGILGAPVLMRRV
tara:strand:- start:375 stop:518 length:144 start_codon:yes stop_codon:yes gene_type:complete